MPITLPSSDRIDLTIRPWKEIFQDLNTSGCSISMISEIIGKKQSTVWYWANNSTDLPDSAARAVLTLHLRYCGHEVTAMRLNESKVIDG